MEIISCQEAYQLMCELTQKQKVVRNLHLDIRLDPWLVETDLFPQEALEVYSAWNLEHDIPADMREKYFSAHRGGSQGDYRDGMRAKIDNIVDCLKQFPQSKRATITIPNEASPLHSDDAAAKCMREVHFYLEGNEVSATVLFRAQAAEIFPKNVHFIGEMVAEVANRLDAPPGRLHYLATTLVADRW
jgi:thymidylate synthase